MVLIRWISKIFDNVIIDLVELAFDSFCFDSSVSMIHALMMAHDSYFSQTNNPPHSSMPLNHNCNISFPPVSQGSCYSNHVDTLSCCPFY